MRDWTSFVRARLAPPHGDPVDEVVEEIAQHVQQLYEGARADGATEAEARALVERELQDGDRITEVVRASRRRVGPTRLASEPPPGRRQPLRAFAADLRYAARVLRKRPAFAAAAVFTLALGIGANTAIFSVVHGLLLVPLPFADPDRLVMVWEADASNLTNRWIVAAPNWADWKAHSATLQDFAIWEPQSFNVSGGPEPEQVGGLRVSASLFRLLGVNAQAGRVFTDAEDAPGHRVAVISDALWHRRFDRAPTAIGRTIRLNGESYEVVGVMPPSFRFTSARSAIWVPIQFTAQDHERGAHSFYAAARLAKGVDFEAARTEMEAIGRRLAAAHPEDNQDEIATITRMKDLGVQPLRPTLVALLGAVAFVLLIACVNVANLVLAQAASRQAEFAIRAALGAGRGRIASQLLAEGLLLAAAGGAAGVLLAQAGTSALASSLPAAIQQAPFRNAGVVAVNVQVLGFTAIVALATGVLFSLVPMLGAAGGAPAASLKAAGDRGGTARLAMFRQLFIAGEVALAVIVLFGAGLMIKSVSRLVGVDPGLDADRVLLMEMALPQADAYGPPVRSTFCSDVQRELSALPGVRSAGAISHVPLSGASAGRALTLEGMVPPVAGEGWAAAYRLTCPGYFATLGIPILAGRDFTERDATAARAVVIINDEMARQYFGDQDPVGRRLKLGRADSANPWLTIVGVAGNVRHFGLDSPVRREIFRPYAQAAWPSMTIALKTQVEPESVIPSARAAVARIDPDQPISRTRTMASVVDESVGGRRFPMLLLTLFSAVALGLAAVGVYGVVTYLVTQRTREMGIRLALGAQREELMRLVVGTSLRPVLTGLALGLIGAIGAARFLRTLLFAVEPADPAVLAAIAALLAATALVACWIPARRAAAVDPVEALRGW